MHTKAPRPIEDFAETLSPQLAAAVELLQLKQLFRQGWLARGVPPERCESVAEHSYGVSMLAMLLSDDFPHKIDQHKLLQLALLHDVGEVNAGDITPADGVASEEKHRRERTGIESVFGRLAERQHWISLWEEYSAETSPEASLVRELDRLEMAIQAIAYHRSEGTQIQEFLASAAAEIESPPIRRLLDEISRLAAIAPKPN